MHSNRIPLGGLRQILLWPLVMRLSETLQRDDTCGTDRKVRAQMGKVIASLSADTRWKEEKDLLNHLPLETSEDRKAAYAEFVYFHDYLQSVLFRQETNPETAEIRLFSRKDIGAIEVTLEDDVNRTFTAKAKIQRCNLYLLATGTAILALELEYDTSVITEGGSIPLALSHTLTINDHLRRVYAPFFYTPDIPALVPLSLRLFGENNTEISALTHHSAENKKTDGLPLAAPVPLPGNDTPSGEGKSSVLDDYLTQTGGFLRKADISERRTPPVFNVWRALVEPLQLAGYSDEKAEHCWRHVVDERIPLISHVSLTSGSTRAKKPYSKDEAIAQRHDFLMARRADMMRLCFADGAGSDPSPYNPGFLDGFESKHCYDRFLPDPATTSASRIMFAGYHTCFVGAGSFFDTHLKTHFRRHYFQMALLTQIEFVSLLAISSRISDAVLRFRRERNSDKAPEARARKMFQDEILEIQRDFLEFVHLYRFSAVSNQTQALEIFDKWRESLALKTLYEDVRVELEAATNYILGLDNKEQATASNWLSSVATLGLVVSIIFALLGMNVFVDGKTIENMTGTSAGCLYWFKTLSDLVVAWVPFLPSDPFSCETGSQGLRVFANKVYISHAVIACAALAAVPASALWFLGRKNNQSNSGYTEQVTPVLRSMRSSGILGMLLFGVLGFGIGDVGAIIPAITGFVSGTFLILKRRGSQPR